MDITRLTKKKQRAKQAANLQQIAEVSKEIGDAYFEAGQLEDALQEYLEQLEACEKLQDKLNVAVAHRMIGEVYANLGEYEQALLHQNMHLEGAKNINNTLEEQRAFATLGRTYFCLAESLDEHAKERKEALANAKDSYTQSIHLCNSLENSNIELKEMMMMRARLLLNLGLILEVQKEPEQAVSLIEQAATLCTNHNLQEDLHRTQIALGGIYERQGNIEQALRHLDSAANTNNPSLNADAKLLKAELLLNSGEWFKSRKILVSLYVMTGLPQNVTLQIEKYLRISVTLCRAEDKLCLEDNVHAKLKLYETLGDAAVAANCFKKAIDYYRQMLSCAEESGSKFTGAALVSLAQTLKDAGQYNEALEFAKRELQLCMDAHEICRSALFLADLSITAKCPDEKIRESYNLALENARQCEDTTLEVSVLKELSYYFENSGQIEDAAQIRQKLDAISKLNPVVESESESEDFKIGTDICLDELSDVEEEMKAKGTVRTTRKRTKKRRVLKKNERGETELHIACINGSIDHVQKLLEAGHPTNIRDHFGWTPLHEAANHGFLEITKLLLDSGADVNDPGGSMCQGVTPLHDAASCGNLSIMRLLMEYGANTILKTNENDTVLDCLEEWKDRAGTLTTDEQIEYNLMHQELSRIIPRSTNKIKKAEISAEKVWQQLVDKDEGTVKNKFERTSAAEDYKRTIARLKHKVDLCSTSADHSHIQCITAPLLNSEQVLMDDWLEDDIGINGKKKSGDNFFTMAKRKHTSHLTCDKIVKRQKTNVMSTIIEPLLTTSEESSDSNISENFSMSNEHNKNKKKHQVSLLSIGFTRASESRTPSPTHMTNINLDSQPIIYPKSIRFQVSVDERKFDMELDLSSKGDELIQNILYDAQNRYYNETGCTVILNLKTINGILVSAENILKILKDTEDVKCVKCEISDVKIPSIIERYNVICKTHNIEPETFMTKCLKSCENTSIFRFRQNQSNIQEHIPILYTLEYETNLQVLCLSGINLHEMGRVLSSCLTKLLNLQELYLQTCDIDSKCLGKLKKLPLCIKIIDLSYNPLQSESIETLHNLLLPLRNLQTLNLQYCQLDSFRLPCNINNLVSLNLSWNSLTTDEICSSLQGQLLNLNLSHTLRANQCPLITSIINNQKFSFLTLQCLELASCELSNADIRSILSKGPNLSKFVLSGNTNVTVSSINLLLAHKPTLMYIDVSACINIAEYPNSDTCIQNPEKCTFIATIFPEVCKDWFHLWQGKGTMNKMLHNLTIFKPLSHIEN